jgi:hypothetical protein
MQVWETRKKDALSHRQPGRKGPEVFRWEEMHVVGGFRERKPVTRLEVTQIWENYGSHQRVFDPVYNEWDICSELDPMDIPDDVAWDCYVGNDDDNDPYFDLQGADITLDPPPTADPQDVTAMANKSEAEANARPDPDWDPLERVLYTRYGLLDADDSSPPSLSDSDLLSMGRIIGQSIINDAVALPSKWHAPLHALIGHLASDSCSAPHRDLDHPDRIAQLIQSSNVRLRLLDHQSGKRFLVEGKASETHLYHIVLSNAATAIQCVRGSWGPRDEDIAWNLARQGIPFSTVMPLPASCLGRAFKERPSVGLGWRKYGYTPGPSDYRAYEAKRDALLRRPHACAALKAGGIIWRLAAEAIGTENLRYGPSSDATLFGTPHSVSGLPPGCDDSFTEAELDLLCGVYKVYDRKSAP